MKKILKVLRRSSSHLIALLLGVVLCFTSFRILASEAEPLRQTPLATEPMEVAKIPVNLNSESFVATAIEKTGPAVVRIDTETVITRRVNPFFEDPFFQDFFGSQMPMERQQRVTGQGSGFIVDEAGIILTNAHVVNGADKVTVTLKDGRTFNGQVRGTDEVTDLAVVKINSQGAKLPVARLGDSSDIRVGDWAIAVGNPVGLDNTVTLGIVSTIGRSAAQAGIRDKRIDFIQTDAAINPGNSGGPLLNAQGEVIGINTAIRTDAMGIGFAIPINKAKALQQTLAAGKEVPHPYIGVEMVNLTPELARDNNQNPNSSIMLPEVEGILVVRVLPNTPAQMAGIRKGDVILKANNQPIKDGGALQTIVENTGINQKIRLTMQRGSQILELTLTTAQMSNKS